MFRKVTTGSLYYWTKYAVFTKELDHTVLIHSLYPWRCLLLMCTKYPLQKIETHIISLILTYIKLVPVVCYNYVILKNVPSFSACSELLHRTARFVYAIYSRGKSCSESGIIIKYIYIYFFKLYR